MKAEMKIEDCELVKASLKFHLLIQHTLFLKNKIIYVYCKKKSTILLYYSETLVFFQPICIVKSKLGTYPHYHPNLGNCMTAE